MNQPASMHRAPRTRRLHLSAVDWKTYTRLLRAFAERPGVCLTYDRGELEIRLPALALDTCGRFLGSLVFVLTDELGLPLKSGGSTTIRRRKRQKGIEADESFWIANAHRMAGRRRLDLRTDPPPDLVIEVDVSRSSLDRMGIHAALRVPELWRLEGDVLTFHVLDADGVYQTAATSRIFPLVASADLAGFVQAARTAGDENTVIHQFRAWVRQRLTDSAATPSP